MPYTKEERGLLNNFAKEPKVYPAEPPTNGQKLTYTILGIAAALLIGGVIFVAFTVSNVS
jgi:hypothetical protein